MGDDFVSVLFIQIHNVSSSKFYDLDLGCLNTIGGLRASRSCSGFLALQQDFKNDINPGGFDLGTTSSHGGSSMCLPLVSRVVEC